MRIALFSIMAAIAFSASAGTNVFDTLQGNGSLITGIPESGVSSLVSDLAAKVPTTRTVAIDNQAAQDLSANRTLTSIPWATNVLQRAIFATNADNGVLINATNVCQRFITNQSFNVSGFSSLVVGATCRPGICYSNSGASSITIGAPPNATPVGAATVSSMTLPSGKQAYWSFDIGGTWTNYLNCQ